MLITPAYQSLQHQFHKERADYGCNAHRWADHIAELAQKLGTRDVLDYGAGKGTLAKNLPFPIQQYDPAIQEFASAPQPANLVACLDVLEHIEPECLEAVLNDLQRLAKQALFVEIATRPAKKDLPDGRNAHLIQMHGNWWLAQLLPRFVVQSVQSNGGSLIALLLNVDYASPPAPAPAAAEEPVPYMPAPAAA